MPVKNTVRNHSPDTFFHIYNRGVEGRSIFCDDDDYTYFVSLLSRFLSPDQQLSSDGSIYKNYSGQVDLNAYCLMPNHFHLLLYQYSDTLAVSRFMASLTIAYSMYFNKKYKRRGPLFENRFKASPIYEDVYLQHISRYIHLNPKNYKSWQYSSYLVYLSGHGPEWLRAEQILAFFKDRQAYKDFVADYESVQRQNESLKHAQADI